MATTKMNIRTLFLSWWKNFAICGLRLSRTGTVKQTLKPRNNKLWKQLSRMETITELPLRKKFRKQFKIEVVSQSGTGGKDRKRKTGSF